MKETSLQQCIRIFATIRDDNDFYSNHQMDVTYIRATYTWRLNDRFCKFTKVQVEERIHECIKN
jgi:hypothetical protein